MQTARVRLRCGSETTWSSCDLRGLAARVLSTWPATDNYTVNDEDKRRSTAEASTVGHGKREAEIVTASVDERRNGQLATMKLSSTRWIDAKLRLGLTTRSDDGGGSSTTE